MIDTGDTAFVLISAALVMVMTPGLAFFYGGLVRRKNFLAIMMQSFISMGVVTVIWVAVGYSLAFSGNVGGVIGNFSWSFLSNVGVNPGRGPRISPPSLTSFSKKCSLLSRPRYNRGVRGPGPLQELPQVPRGVEPPGVRADRALDLGRGLSGQVGRARLCRRHGGAHERRLRRPGLRMGRGCPQVGPRRAVRPHNVAFVGLGTGLLWFGWFGFNGGSALAANGIAAQAFVNTDIAASVAMCAWTAISWWRSSKPSVVGAFTGAVAGLACITPCAGFVPTWAAFVIGFLAGGVCYLAIEFRNRMKWDDALDVWAVHGVGGLLGSILLGVFAYLSVNAAGSNGLFAGDAGFLGKQVAAALLVAAYAFAVTWLILKVLNRFEPVRVPDEVEQVGLDSEMEELQAYDLT